MTNTMKVALIPNPTSHIDGTQTKSTLGKSKQTREEK